MSCDTVVIDVQAVSCNLRMFAARVDEQPKSLKSELFEHTTVCGDHTRTVPPLTPHYDCKWSHFVLLVVSSLDKYASHRHLQPECA